MYPPYFKNILHFCYFLPVYLNNCSYEIIHKQMIDYLGNNCLENEKNRSYKCCIKIEL